MYKVHYAHVVRHYYYYYIGIALYTADIGIRRTIGLRTHDEEEAQG